MSRQVDLLPRTFRDAYGRQLCIRRWIGIYVVTAMLLIGLWGALAAGQGAQVRERNELQRQVKQNWERNVEAQGILAEIQTLEQTIFRYERLAWPVRISDVVSTIGALLPDSITLTSMGMTPYTEHRSSRTRRGSSKSEAEEEDPPRSFLIIETEGIAPSDIELAQFVSGVDEHPLFSEVSMDYARFRDVDGTDAREFRITLKIDMSARYEFEPSVAQGRDRSDDRAVASADEQGGD